MEFNAAFQELKKIQNRTPYNLDSNMFGAVIVLVSDKAGRRPVIGFVTRSYEELPLCADGLPLAIPGETGEGIIPYENILGIHVLSKIELGAKVLGSFLYEIENEQERLDTVQAYLYSAIGNQYSPYFWALKLLIPSEVDQEDVAFILKENVDRGLAADEWTVIVHDYGEDEGQGTDLFVPYCGPKNLIFCLYDVGVPMAECMSIQSEVGKAAKWDAISWQRVANLSRKKIHVVAYVPGNSPIGIVEFARATYEPRD